MIFLPPEVASGAVLLDGSGRSFNRLELEGTTAARGALLVDDADENLIAISQPSNAELALNVLAAMTVGVAAPMNPAATEGEAKAYLEDLRPRIVVTSRSSAAGRAARSLGIEVLDPERLAAARQDDGEGRTPDPAAVALVLPTSGTTGRPKLVPLTHQNLHASARNVADSLHLTGDDRCLGLMPYFHIHGLVAGLLAPIVSGGSVIATGELRPGRTREWLEEHGPTWYSGVPTMHRAVLDALGKAVPTRHRLRLVRSSSSPLAPALMRELEEVLGVPVVEAYGMTEASHQMATNPLPPKQRKAGTVGVASGPELAILADGEVHTDSDRTGEVVVRGPTVTVGYRNNPEANAAAFHEGWFRTGDLGCLDTDGYLQLVGRLKEMINRGGEKIAPREIDDALLEHPAVALATAFPYPHPTLGEDVAAIVVLRPGEEVAPAELVQFVASRLSPYKVPRRVIISTRLPVGPTGKPQRHRMADQLGLAGSVPDNPDKQPRSPLEAIWGECLQLERVPNDADFFALGGDSLRAMDLVTTVEERLHRTVPLVFFGDGPVTLQRMQSLIAASEPSPVADPMPADPGGAISSAERGVLARSILDPAGALYNVPIALRIEGPLDVRRLRSAVVELVAVNEGLRTSYPRIAGRTVRSVAAPVALHIDVRAVGPGDDWAGVLRAEARRPFDLQAGPLLRAIVIELGEDDHILMVTAHHSVVDGMARDLVLETLAIAYRAPSTAPLPASTPGAIAALQVAHLATGSLDGDRAYWLEQLTPVPEPLELPLTRSNVAGHSWVGDVVTLQLDEEASDSLRAVARSCRTTPFAVLLSGVAATLSRLTGATEIVIGTPASNRHGSGATKVVGMLANMLPLRLDVSGDPSFEELVGRVRAVTLDALAHQRYPYEHMVEDVRQESAVGLDGLFRVVVQLRAALPTPDFGGDIAVTPLAVPTGTAKFDLNFDIRDDAKGIGGTVEFNTAVFDRTRVEDICRRLGRLLAGAVAAPGCNLGRLPILDPDEAHEVVAGGRGPQPVPPARNVIDLIIDQAQRAPDAPAVISVDGSMSRGELDAQTRRVACALASLGVGRGDTVAISVHRDGTMVPALLGVLRAGAAYLPLDPTYPPARLAAMAAGVPLRLVVHAGADPTWLPPNVDAMSIADLLEFALEDTTPAGSPGPADAAVILSTSGSTGTPKGVIVPHAAIVNMLSWTSTTFDAGELEGVLVGASLSFDFSLFQIFAPLATGGCAVVVDNVLALRDLPTVVTLLSTVPAALDALLRDDAIPAHVRTIVSGGEVLGRELAARLLALPQRPRLVNIYGPTEATVLCCAAELDAAAVTPPMGRPIAGALTLVMDRYGRPLPSGIPGELWIGGLGLSQGYMNDAPLTANRFVVTDVAGMGEQRMYRTGDLVRADRDGTLHFVRRLDNQLKVRGMRIEPGDVEAALLTHPAVTAAAVYAVGDSRRRELRAAITSRGPVDAEELRAFAAHRLPKHMVPRRVEILVRFPVTPNGKVDRKALATMSANAELDLSPGEPHVPDQDREPFLLALWGRLLSTPDLDIDSDFFDAGGDSLLVLAMLTEVEQVTGTRLPLAWCFNGSVTIRRLAAELRWHPQVVRSEGRPTSASPLVIPVKVGGSRPPLFIVYADASSTISAGPLAQALHPDQPVYALAPIWNDVESRKDVAQRMASAITETTAGYLHLAGHSFGGLVAYETAALLQERGQAVGALILVDASTPEAFRRRGPVRLRRRLRMALRIPVFWRSNFLRAPGVDPPDVGIYQFPVDRAGALYSSGNPTPLDRPLHLLTTAVSRGLLGAHLGWDTLHEGELISRHLAGDHLGFVHASNAHYMAEALDACLDATLSPPAESNGPAR